MKGLKGLATGIGSLPHTNVDAALDLVFKYTPNIPFWPQLPKRDIREGMVAQFSENLPALMVNQDGPYFSEGDATEKELERFYQRIIDGKVDDFQISQEYALGLHKFYQRLKKSDDLGKIEFIKCQVTGPFTFAASYKHNGKALLHDLEFLQIVVRGLSMKAHWQIKLFQEFGKNIILFIDEPYLGCFGSAYTPLNREDVVRYLGELTTGIKEGASNVLIGIHCCGNTDWSIFTDVSTIDIINFDAFSFLDKFVLYADNLKGFLKKGGIICWGIVPTQEFSGSETPDSLVSKIKEGIDTLVKKGMDYDLLLENLILSPSCGMGSLDTQKSEKILKLLSETSLTIKNIPKK